MRFPRSVRAVIWIALALCPSACLRQGDSGSGATPARSTLKLATTTSTDNSGLLAVLLPPFERETGIRVHVIAVGTGKALKLGETGDVDAVLVHARDAEDAFVAAGHGVNRRDVMYNDFVLLGAEGDPAGVVGRADVVEALTAISRAGSSFVSRGDDSGTHKMEKALWRTAGIAPEGPWYMETGQGMGNTLVVANEKRAYCLADRGTFIAFQGKIDLEVLVEGDPRLFNPYGIIAVNPARHRGIRYREAMQLIAWVTSPGGRKVIGSYRMNGEVLFHPHEEETRE